MKTEDYNLGDYIYSSIYPDIHGKVVSQTLTRLGETVYHVEAKINSRTVHSNILHRDVSHEISNIDTYQIERIINIMVDI